MNYKFKKIILAPMDLLYKINPELELKIMFMLKNNYSLSLNRPKMYNEKLQWLKLYYRNEILPSCTDKFEVRKFVKDKGSENILNELLWQGFNPEEIPFNDLPNQFVIKVTHGSGFNIICKNKKNINEIETINKLNKWLNHKFIPAYGEWFYGVIKPRIIIEKLLVDENNNIPEDYKIFCFDGEPKYIIVDTGRFDVHKRNVYDLNWNLMEGYSLGFPNDSIKAEKPRYLNDLLIEASRLSKGFPHVRVDFYIVKNKIYFGEMTFTNGAGFDKIKPKSFDLELGNYIKLPKKYS